jgi:hypothetical protein
VGRLDLIDVHRDEDTMSVGKICRCKRIVMPAESHSCPELEAATAADNARRHSKQREHGRDTRGWRRLSVERRELAGGLCELKLPGCTTFATTGHLHRELEGRHELATIDDVDAACAHCHGVVDAPNAKGGSREAPGERARPVPGSARVMASVAITSPGNKAAR